MIIESNINKIPYEMSLSKFFCQVTKGIYTNFCVFMTFIHRLMNKNEILITFCQHCIVI